MVDARVVFQWDSSDPGNIGWYAILTTGDSPAIKVGVGEMLTSKEPGRHPLQSIGLDDLERLFKEDYPETTRRYKIEFVIA